MNLSHDTVQMQKLNVLVISKYYPPYATARAYQIEKVVQSILGTGYADIFVIAGTEIEKNEPQRPGVCEQEKNSAQISYLAYKKLNYGKSIVARILKRIRYELGSVSRANEWTRSAVTVANELIKKNNINIILTSSTPFDSHMVGLLLADTHKMKWIASFSDPWPSGLMPSPYNKNAIPLFSLWQARQVRQVLRKSTAVHMPNSTVIKYMQAVTSVPILEKSFAIPHVANNSAKGQGEYNIENWLVHIGSLDKERVSPALLEAVVDIGNRDATSFKGILFVGYVCTEFKKLVEKKNAEDYVMYVGEVPPSVAGGYAISATALLVIEAPMPVSPFLPSKFADYACTCRPIIAITPKQSPIREFLTRYGGGIAVTHETNEIKQAIQRIFLEKELAPDPDREMGLCSAFSAQQVGSTYMEMLMSVAGVKNVKQP